MTESLKNLMRQQADATEFAVPDVDALVTSGTRRLRRQRAMSGLAGVAAVALIGGIFVTVSGDDNAAPKQDYTTVDPLPVGEQVTWARNSVLHTVGSSTDVGHVINAYVRTEIGYVFSDPSGTVFSFVGGRVSEVGTSDKEPHLVSDPDSSLAGWVDLSGAKPAFVVLDQATGEVTKDDSHTTNEMDGEVYSKNAAYFYAIDDGVAYWRDGRGAVAVDVTSKDTTVIDPEATNGVDVFDAESGVVAFNPSVGLPKLGATLTSAKVELKANYPGTGIFSPDGKYLAFDIEYPVVVDSTTGRRVNIPRSGYGVPIEWLDDTHLMMLSFDETKMSAQLSIKVCSVGAQAQCEVVAPDLGTFNEVGNFAFPDGISTDE